MTGEAWPAVKLPWTAAGECSAARPLSDGRVAVCCERSLVVGGAAVG